MAGNDAEGKAPTIEEEMAKFQSFAARDGEIASGRPVDEDEDQARREEAAGTVNRRSHAENVAAGKTGTEGEAAGAAKEVTLTDAEEAAAIAAAEKAEGTELTADEKAAVLAAALADKNKAVARDARKAAKAARYNDNHRQARAAERRADAAERRAETLERRLETLEKREGKAPLTRDKAAGNDDGKPDPKDDTKYPYGELDGKYIADLTRWQTLKAIAEEKESEKTTKQTEAEAEAAAAFKERVDTFAEESAAKYDDFQEVVMDTMVLPKDDPDYWPCSPMLGELLLESEHGADIAYELASDPKEAWKIAKLSPARQAAWFGTKEAELSAGSAAPANKKGDAAAAEAAAKGRTQIVPRESKAPIPLKTKLNGSGGNRVPNDATTDFAAFEAMASGTKR